MIKSIQIEPFYLFSIGAYSLATARRLNPKWIPLAIYPVAFSIQQATEGVLWLGINSNDQAMIAVTSRGFLFFSHFFWLVWVPLSVYCFEDEPWRQKLLFGLTGIGTLFGLTVFLPSLFLIDWLSVEVVQHSLEYKTTLIYDGIVNRPILRSFYAAIVVSALLLSADHRIPIFGALIAVSLFATYLFFAYAFISVWCFFAAILSAYILMILLMEKKRQL